MTEKHSYEIIVLDLDGTLTNRDKVITPKTKQRLMRQYLQGRGKERMIVTGAAGRPTPGVLPLARELELAKYGSYILSFNGGRITNCKTGEIIFSRFPAAGGESEDYTPGRGGTGGAFELR